MYAEISIYLFIFILLVSVATPMIIILGKLKELEREMHLRHDYQCDLYRELRKDVRL